MEKDYSAQGKLDIHFVAPKGYVLSEKTLSDVSVNFFGNGFEILKFKLFHKGQMDITLPDRQGDFIFRNDQLNALIREQSDTEVDIVANTLEEIRLFSDLQTEKRIPVVSALEFEAKPGYFIQGDVAFIPDSVRIKGPKKIIDSVSYIATVERELTGLSQSMEDEIELNNVDGVKVIPGKVNFRIYLEQLTEKQLKTSLLKHLEIAQSDSLLLIPSEAVVVLSLPISQYDNFSEDMLTYQLKTDSLIGDQPDGMHALQISSELPSVQVLSYQPDSLRILKVVAGD